MEIIKQMLLDNQEAAARREQLLVNEIKELKSMQQQLAQSQAPNVTFNDNRQLHINLVNFSDKKLPDIDMKRVLELTYSQPTGQIIPTIIQHLHGNPEFPEYQNIYMDEVGSEMTIVFGGDEEKTWHTMPRRAAINQLKTEAMGVLTHENKRMISYQLIEAAHEAKLNDMEYHGRINDLICEDLTDDIEIAKKLVAFGETFHKNRK